MGSKPRLIGIGILAYVVVAASIGSTIAARGVPFRSHPGFFRLLAWQAPTYVVWGAVAALIAYGTRPRWIIAILTVAGPVAVGLMSSFNVWWTRLAHPDGALRAK